ncbi:MAG: hypothetical protein M0Q24_08565 [Sulfurimonas sp.]|uniref:hypothetical protein n=1 Tax=Sulfurimonas sp. TaxID=2022749 RepID=UPI0025F8A1AA|nr:hypothetical protein [Sulfurimonas sp.]MCK9492131.1 hypothetical protein [Sulfurimonas sp.]
MKLIDILNEMNSFEKNSFLKILDNIIVGNSLHEQKEVEAILSSADGGLKNADFKNIVKVFDLLEKQYSENIVNELTKIESQIDFISNILIRDGNSIMKYDWFSKLYEKEIKQHKDSVKSLENELSNNLSELSEERIKDYKIYKACLQTAYHNDELNNQESKITSDEQSILTTLANELSLSQNELQLIKYMILPLKKHSIDEIINDLKNAGIIFFSKKTNIIYISNEIVSLLRKIKGREVADKHVRRILKLLTDPQLNMVCRKHNIAFKNVQTEEKIKTLVNSGISFRKLLSEDIFKTDISLTERKNLLNDIAENGLNFAKPLKGSTVDEKIDSLIEYFNDIDLNDSIGISIGGYEHLLVDLEDVFSKEISIIFKKAFELQEENILNANMLLNYNIKPRDLLEILDTGDLKKFCVEKSIKSRGNIVLNILEAYKNNDYLEIENYASIGLRDLNTLKSNGLIIKEAELGVKFEDITKNIFIKLGLNVDEKLRKEISTNKDKIDIVLRIGDNEIIIVECKSIKESGYNKFSSVSRQIKSYVSVAQKKGYSVVKSLLISPEFTNDFINECELDFDLNLSLIQAETLKNILEAFEASKLQIFPFKLFRDVLIKEERIIMAIKK